MLEGDNCYDKNSRLRRIRVVPILNEEVRVIFIGKIVQLRTEGGERVNYDYIWEERTLHRKAGAKAKSCLADMKKEREPMWLERGSK